jgi:error-prone DNA polymerase
MKIAMVGAGFSGAKANKLRRAMASFRNHGTVGALRADFIEGMLKNGYTPDFANRCFKQIEGFSDYGFPESHSASFALLAYASSWLKCHYPDVFACALLNAQPMGFYSASSIVRDFRDHGGEVRPADINHSDWDHTLEPTERNGARTACGGGTFALRLGMRQVDGMNEDVAKRMVAVRGRGFDSVRDLYFRARLDTGTLQRLARADAFRSVGLDRRAALWAVRGLSSHLGGRAAVEDLPLFAAQTTGKTLVPFQHEEEVDLPPLLPGEHVINDYATLSLSLKAHPVSFLRGRLNDHKILRTAALADHPADRTVRVAGLVLVRQRPGTASGVIFMTLEDESGIANIIVWPKIYEDHRRIVHGARMIVVEGTLQKEKEVIHVIARQIADLTPDLMESMTVSDAAPSAAETPQPSAFSLWRHPRDTRVLPKGRNFH